MATEYIEPPQFALAHLIAEGDFVTALGEITVKDEQGREAPHAYCDVWRFRGDKIAALQAFVIVTDKDATDNAA